MNSDLFYLKQIAAFNQKNDDKIVSLETNDNGVLFGTSKGKIIRFLVDDGKLTYIDSVFLSSNPITQISVLPAVNLLLAVNNRLLFTIISSSLTIVGQSDHGAVESISVNRKMKKNPSVILFAQATNKKQILICKSIITDEGLDVEVIEKISISSNVTNLCFDGKSICYSTRSKYYVLDLTAQPRIHHELIALNESTNSHIVSVGENEYAICGPDGLIVFIGADGSSFKPPIDLNTQVIDMIYVKPMLYIIGTGKLMAYSMYNENLKITLGCDNLQLLTHTTNRLILLSSDKRCFELTLADLYSEKIKEALQKSVDEGLRLIESVKSVFPNDNNILTLCNDLILIEAIDRLDSKDFNTGLDLFLKTNANPNVILSRIQKLNNNNEASQLLDIDLDVVQSFLNKLMSDETFLDYSMLIKSYLIRMKILNDEIGFNDIDETLVANEDFKNWLIFNNFHVLLAEFYFEYGMVKEALDAWKDYIGKSDFEQEKIESLMNRLLSLANESDQNAKLLTDMLKWLTPKMPELSMQIVKQMFCVDLEWLNETFEAYPNLLLEYLQTQVDECGQNDQKLNLHLTKAFISSLKSGSIIDWKTRNSFRSFLITIPFNNEILLTIPKTKEFEIERLLYSTTIETVESAIKQLLDVDLDSAEILYVKFSSQKPHLIKFLIPKYIKEEDKSGKMQERLLRLLCEIQPFNGIEQIIADLPASYMTRDLIALFQNAVKEYNQSRSNLCLRLAIDKLIKENELDNQLEKQETCIRYDFTSKCELCKDQLRNENISFMQNKVVHSRCLRKL